MQVRDVFLLFIVVLPRVYYIFIKKILQCSSYYFYCSYYIHFQSANAAVPCVPTILTIEKLQSKPLNDVVITLSINEPKLASIIEFIPKSFTVAAASWASVEKDIQIRAHKGVYNGFTSMKIIATPASIDPKYNNVASIGTQSAQLTLVSTQPELLCSGSCFNAIQRVSEGARYLYKIELALPPESLDITITTTLSTSDPRCKITNGTSFTFNSNTWDQVKEISISVEDDKTFKAKEVETYSCIITHQSVRSSDKTKFGSDKTLSLSIVSLGCGDGEYLGAFDRGTNDQSSCVCSIGFYLNGDCKQCELTKTNCTALNTTLQTIPTAKGFYRETIQDTTFYSCDTPSDCRGGQVFEQCISGHEGALCAVCYPGYVRVAGVCK